MNCIKAKIICAVSAVLVVLATLVLATCALDGSGSITINLPPIESRARAIAPERVEDLKDDTKSYRVTVEANGQRTEKSGTTGTFTFRVPIWSMAEITVECLNANGEVIVRAQKTITVYAGANNVDIKLSQDGDEITPPVYTITFSAGSELTGVQMPSPQSVVSGKTSHAWTNPIDGMKGNDKVFFVGWKITATDGAVVNADAGAITSYSPTQDVTLTAQWLIAVSTNNITYPQDITLTAQWLCMSDHEVTQKEWDDVIGLGDASAKITTDYGKGDNFPMYYVSWYDALVYCNKRSMQENLNPCYTIKNSTNPDDWGNDVPTAQDNEWDAVTCDFNANGYRLPIEAEWEYMAKGGENYTYSGSDDIGEVAWYKDNSSSKTHEVKGKKPNKYGMYDMSGNVREWCWDWYTVGSDRVGRGGSRGNNPVDCAISDRYNYTPYTRYGYIGLRVVRSR